MGNTEALRRRLGKGLVIPACPLALTRQRRLSERHQRALVRYYRAAGAGGLAVGVHTTQFAIRKPEVGLYRPVLELALDTANESRPRLQPFVHTRGGKNPSSAAATAMKGRSDNFVLVAGVCGQTRQALAEAALAAELGYHCVLLSLGAMHAATERELIDHCRAVAEVLPIFGFYLQPAAGGRPLALSFWRRFAEIPNVVGIKIAPFNRYQTLDVVRAVIEAERDDIALYTGNDDNIVMDLLTACRFEVGGKMVQRRIVGGLLGHWAVWTRRAVELHAACRAESGRAGISSRWLRLASEVTDANSALFDPGHQFAGCIPGIHEVLRRQGLLPGTYCLDPGERLSPGQREEIDRVCRTYPHLTDDYFVAAHRDEWLDG